jgi:hypothetical protein
MPINPYAKQIPGCSCGYCLNGPLIRHHCLSCRQRKLPSKGRRHLNGPAPIPGPFPGPIIIKRTNSGVSNRVEDNWPETRQYTFDHRLPHENNIQNLYQEPDEKLDWTLSKHGQGLEHQNKNPRRDSTLTSERQARDIPESLASRYETAILLRSRRRTGNSEPAIMRGWAI